MIKSDHPIVQEKASQGIKWAVLLAKGTPWQNLSNGQKRAANKACGNTGMTNGAVKSVKAQRVVSAPVAKAIRVSNPNANIRTLGKTCTITHREYLGQIQSRVGTGLQYLSRVLNPSELNTFPWLSAIAAGYEKYRFTNCQLHYTSSCSTSTSGKVVLAYDLDSSDALPPDIASIYNMQGQMGIAPWDSAHIQVPTDNVTRFVSDNTTSDPKLVNLGKLLICNYGQAATDSPVIGEASIQYTVVLSTPQNLASQTQVGNEQVSRGPSFFSASLAGDNRVLTLNAPGKFFVYTKTSPVPTSVTLSGFDLVVPRDTGGDGTYSYEVTSSVGAGMLVINNTGAIDSFYWYVSRI